MELNDKQIHQRVTNAIDNYFLDIMGKPTYGHHGTNAPTYEKGDANIITNAVSLALSRAHDQWAEEDDESYDERWEWEVRKLTDFLIRWKIYDA